MAVRDFVDQYSALASSIGERIGVSPNILLGQWGLETGWGKSVIPGTNNLGNIKSFDGSGVAATDNMTGSNDNYRQYGDSAAFGDDFASLLERRYKGAIGVGSDAESYAKALKSGGYAEDPAYVKKLITAANMARDAGASDDGRMTGKGNGFDDYFVDSPWGAPKAPRAAISTDGFSNDYFLPETPSAPVSKAGLMSDMGNLLKSGVNQVASGLREAVRQIPVVGDSLVSGADAVDKFVTGKTSDEILKGDNERIQGALSDKMRGALDKKWWNSETQSLGDAWTDPRAYAGGIIQSLPGTLLTMIPAGRLAKMAYEAKVATLGAEESAKAAARTAMLAGGAGEGLLSAGQTAGDIREELAKLPQSVWDSSDAYKSLIASGMDDASAKAALTNDAATKGFLIAGVTTAMFGGQGDRVLALAMRGGVSGGIGKRIVKGVIGEGFLEEAPQSYTQEIAKNVGVQTVDPTRQTTEGAFNAALGGLAVGAVQGGGMNALLGRSAPGRTAKDAETLSEAATLPVTPVVTPEEIAAIPQAPAELSPREQRQQAVADKLYPLPAQRETASTAERQLEAINAINPLPEQRDGAIGVRQTPFTDAEIAAGVERAQAPARAIEEAYRLNEREQQDAAFQQAQQPQGATPLAFNDAAATPVIAQSSATPTAAAGGNAVPQVTLRSDGQPFATLKAAETSIKARGLSGAVAVSVKGGGFGIRMAAPASTPINVGQANESVNQRIASPVRDDGVQGNIAPTPNAPTQPQPSAQGNGTPTVAGNAMAAGLRGGSGTNLADAGKPQSDGAGIAELKNEIGWAEQGGRMIRAAGSDGTVNSETVSRKKWIPKSDFWPNRPKQGGAITEAQASVAIDKAIAGQSLNARERRFVEYAAKFNAERTLSQPALEQTEKTNETDISEAEYEHYKQTGEPGFGWADGFDEAASRIEALTDDDLEFAASDKPDTPQSLRDGMASLGFTQQEIDDEVTARFGQAQASAQSVAEPTASTAQSTGTSGTQAPPAAEVAKTGDERARDAELFRKTKSRLIDAFIGKSGENFDELSKTLTARANDKNDPQSKLAAEVLDNFDGWKGNYEQRQAFEKNRESANPNEAAAKALESAAAALREVGKPSTKPTTTAEDAIRAAANAVPNRTIGSWYPITVEFNGVTQQFLSNIKRVVSDGKTSPAIHLLKLKIGRLVSWEEARPLVNGYRLTSANHLVEEGIPRDPSEQELARWEKAFGALESARPALDLTAPTESKLRADDAKQKRDAADKAAKDNAPSPEGFALSGSNREADVGAAAGQDALFSRASGKNAEMANDKTVVGNTTGRSADDVNSGATTASQMLDVIERDPYADYAIRVIPGEFTGSIRVGDTLPASNKWEDGTDTGEPLSGTSGIGIEQRTIKGVEQAIHRIGSSKTAGPNGFYFGNRVVLIKGESIASGEDVGERIIQNAEVVGIWTKPTKGKSEVLPSEQTASQSGDALFSRADTIEVDGEQRPRNNSNGKPIAATDEGIRNFWRWFGSSKVVDEQGRPLVVYHGTTKAGFSVFDTDGKGKTAGTGAFFTQSTRGAMTYSNTKKDATISDDPDFDPKYDGENGNYPVYLKLTDPETLDFGGKNWDAYGAEPEWFARNEDGDIVEYFTNEADASHYRDTSDDFVEIEESLNTDGAGSTDDLAREARRNGRDGLILENITDEGPFGQGYGWDEKVWVVFSPNQIKSATGNTGAFSPDNADIRYSRAKDSVAAKRDADYMAAIEAGDMEAAQRIVDQAARDAGYVSGDEYRMSHRAPNREDSSLATIKTTDLVPADYWTRPDWYQSSSEEWQSYSAVSDALRRDEALTAAGKPVGTARISLYRAVPKTVKENNFRNGDWATPSREYAVMEGRNISGGYRIIETKTPLKNVWWDGNSIAEVGYDTSLEYVYKNTKNNRKRIDTITRDGDGNIIPLSKRFDSRNSDARYSRDEQQPTATNTHAADVIAKAAKTVNIPLDVYATPQEASAKLGIDIPSDARGLFYKGRAALISSNITSPRMAEFVLWHELLHAGITLVAPRYGNEYNRIMQDLAMRNTNIIKAARDWRTSYGAETIQRSMDAGLSREQADKRMRLMAIEEALADLAGSNAEIKGWSQFVAKLQALLRSMGGFFDNLADWIEGKTQAETLQLIARTRDAITSQDLQITTQVPAFAREEEDSAFQRAYHGTPHKFDKFSLDKVGTGEGAQAYGYGLYFASKREIAEHYRNALGRPDSAGLSRAQDLAAWAYSMQSPYAGDAMEHLNDEIARMERHGKFNDKVIRSDYEEAKRIVASGEVISNGKLYQVDIPEDSEMLHWDKPLSEQSDEVKALANKYDYPLSRTGGDFQKWASSASGGLTINIRGPKDRAGLEKQASDLFKKNGIRGIKYLDGASRTAGDGSYNYVVFDDKDVNIEAVHSRATNDGMANDKTVVGNTTGRSADDVTSGATPLTESQFERKYFQHIDVRARQTENRSASLDAIMRDGFKPGPASVNVLPVTRGRPFANIVERNYSPRAGDLVYLVPREFVDSSKGRSRVKEGYKPKPFEVIDVKTDNPDMYAEYRAALAKSNEQTTSQDGDVAFSRTGSGDLFDKNATTQQSIYNGTEAVQGMGARSAINTGDNRSSGASVQQAAMQERVVRAETSGRLEPTSNFGAAASETDSTPKYRIIDTFGNGKRIEYHDDKRGLMYIKTTFTNGRVFWKPTEIVDGIDYWLSDNDFPTLEAAVAAVRGLRISQSLKSRNQSLYGDIPNLWQGESKKVAKAIIDAGYEIDDFSRSTQSSSKYIYLRNGVKVRLADHALPGHYEGADVDFRYGGNIKDLLAEIASKSNEQTTSQDGDVAFSRTGNGDIFDKNATDAQSTYNGTEAVQGIGASVKNVMRQTINIARDKRGAALSFLGGRQIADIYSKDVPELPKYNEILQRMQAEQNEGSAVADSIIEKWRVINRKRPEVATQLSSLMHDSTLAQVDPDVSADNAELRKRWINLPQEAKDIYREARDAYVAHFEKVKAELIDRVERSALDTSAKNRTLASMREEFTKAMKGVYFPLARFGDYMVVVKDKAGVTQAVSMAETTNQAQALRAELLRAYPDYVVGAIQKKKEFNAERDGVSRGFMKDLVALISEEPDAQTRDSQLDAINQLWLSSLPDLSWAKSGIHRKGTPGYSNDAMRAFARNMFHGGYHLAKLRYGDRLGDTLAQMQETIDNKVRSNPEYSNVVAQSVVDEMNARHKHVMNPQNTPVANALTGLGFMWHMGLSPASAVVNLSQTALVAYPMLASKFGFGKAATMLLSLSADAVKGKNDLLSQLQGAEKDAYDRAVREGLIDVTMAHDLAGVSQGKSGEFNEKQQRVMRVASVMFHEAEKFNRGVTFMSAYRLAVQSGVSDPYKLAHDLTFDSHFDYSSQNRPRVMQGPTARVILLFKQYGQNMIYTLSRNTFKALQGDREAQKTLAGLLAMHGMFAGALGLPLMTTLLAAASAIGGSDDEPWDAQVALRNYLADAFGKDIGEVLAHGVFRAPGIKDAIGADISGRVGLDSMLIRMPQETLEGKKYYQALLETIAGPVFGIGGNIANGMQTMAQGNTLRGIEEMLPKSIKDPLKAYRYEQDGIQDKTGITIVDETTIPEEVAQFLGFSPARGMEGFEGKSAIKNQETLLTQRRRQLMQRYGKDAEEGDTADSLTAIQRWNIANPTMAIKGQDLLRSMREKAKRQAEAENGAYLSKKRRGLAELGEFANAE